jgi:hypothetical protein
MPGNQKKCVREYGRIEWHANNCKIHHARDNEVVSYRSGVGQHNNKRTGYAFCSTDCGKPGIESKNSNEGAGGQPGNAGADQLFQHGRKDMTCHHQSNVSAQIERVGFVGD